MPLSRKIRAVPTETFLELTIKRWLSETEETLQAISIPLQSNPGEKLAIGLCRGKNPGVLYIKFCATYYSGKGNYEVQSMHFERATDDEILSFIIKLQVNVPVLTTFQTMTLHRLAHVPVPLHLEDGFYHFYKYEKLPTYFAAFPGLLDRKISLDDCELIDNIFFCRYNILNELYSTTAACINTIMTKSSSSA